MKILIVGIGKVGSTLAEHLSLENHQVTVIDTSKETLSRISDRMDVRGIRGNGASIPALRLAGVHEMDIVIAATNLDEVNMVCCLTSKRLGAKYTIARIRSVEYTTELATLRQELGIDMVINPEYATAVEISRLLRFPAAANIDTFFRGRVELVSFVVQERDFLAGRPLSELSRNAKALPVLVCAAERGSSVLIPDGSFTPRPGDKLYLVGEPVGIQAFFRLLGRLGLKIRSACILGGSRIAQYLIAQMETMGVEVKLVEKSEERCRALSEALPRTLVICGDGTDQELLASEHLSSCDAFIALTDRDEDNLFISLYALQQGVSKAIAKSNRLNYINIAQSAGLDSIVSPKLLTAGQILQLVRGMQSSMGSVMTALYQIADGKAEAMEFVADYKTLGLGVPLQKLSLKKGILIAAILHNGKVIIPEGTSSISVGDSVILISRNQIILDLNEVFEPAQRGSITPAQATK